MLGAFLTALLPLFNTNESWIGGHEKVVEED